MIGDYQPKLAVSEKIHRPQGRRCRCLIDRVWPYCKVFVSFPRILSGCFTLLVALTQSANAALVQLPSDPGFATVINFDSMADDVKTFDQYVAQGVKFRDTLSTFANASTDPGTSPGDTSNKQFRSPLNSLKAADVFVLFETPVMQVGAYVRNENAVDNITLTAYGTDLISLGTVTIAPGEVFLFLGAAINGINGGRLD